MTGPIPHKVPEMFEPLPRGAEAAGRTASRDQIVLSYGLHLADSHDQAVAEIADGARRELTEFVAGVNQRPTKGKSSDEMFESYVESQLIGTPDDVTARIEKMQDVSGGFGGILFMSRDWAGTAASNRSWETFAREVAPRFGSKPDQQTRAARAAQQLNAST